jgi:3-oxoacid CoA-transferase subunit A
MNGAAEAVAVIRSGSNLAVRLFRLRSLPSLLVDALLSPVARRRGGLQQPLSTTPSHRLQSVGGNNEVAAVPLGELKVGATRQGTLAERMRAGGSGIEPGLLYRERRGHHGGGVRAA